MLNLPSITPAEIAMIAAAFLVLYLIPLLLASIDALRQRHAQAMSRPAVPEDAAIGAASRGFMPEQHAETAHAFAAPDAPVRDGADPIIASTDQPNGAAVQDDGAAADAFQVRPELPEVDRPSPAHQPPAAIADTPDVDGIAVPTFEPFTAASGHRFRLEDLHQVRLPDCATTARTQLWRAGERMAQAHGSAVLAATLVSPYPVRSACLDAVAQDGWKVRLSYLLFPSLWPVSREHAAAQVVFDIDTVSGTVTSQVHALRPSDLSEDTRRAIRDSGGEI